MTCDVSWLIFATHGCWVDMTGNDSCESYLVGVGHLWDHRLVIKGYMLWQLLADAIYVVLSSIIATARKFYADNPSSQPPVHDRWLVLEQSRAKACAVWSKPNTHSYISRSAVATILQCMCKSPNNARHVQMIVCSVDRWSRFRMGLLNHGCPRFHSSGLCCSACCTSWNLRMYIFAISTGSLHDADWRGTGW